MFDNLSDKLQRVFKNLRGEGKLTAANMEAALREIRVALPKADVNCKVTREIAPIHDIRSSANYRMRVAANLLEEFLFQSRGNLPPTPL